MANFGQGILYQLDGPDTIAYERVNSTVWDFTTNVLGILPPWQWLFVGITAVFGLHLLWSTHKKSPQPAMPTGAALLLTLLITPYALQYDYVPLTLLLFLIALHWRNLPIWAKLIIVSLLLFSFSVLLWQTWSYQGYWALLAYLFAFCILNLNIEKNNEYKDAKTTKKHKASLLSSLFSLLI